MCYNISNLLNLRLVVFNKELMSFSRNSSIEIKADLGEKVGNIGFGLLRIGFGKTMTVEKISGGGDKITFTEKVYSTSAKVAAVALFVFASPVTIPLAAIGFIGTAFSKSHGQIFKSYIQNQQMPTGEVGKSLGRDSVPTPTQDVQPAVNEVEATGLISSKIEGSIHGSEEPALLEDDVEIHQQNPTLGICTSTPEDKAATTIQKCVRGYLARKPHLPSHLYPQYNAQCEKAKGPESDSIPQAQGGKTRVYLPKEMPGIVLKNSGRKAAITRFHQMQEVRSILDSQNSSHLIIPKANLCQDFLVEQRLPINVDKYHNMGLYLSQPQMFDEAVRELTRLFSRVFLSDLISCQYEPLGHITDVEDNVRYDNLPLYVVEENGKKEGKIGLIDLEHIQKGPSYKGLITLARIFPFHLDVIKNEASKLKIEIREVSLDASAEKGRKYLQVGFIDHLNWLKKKGISTEMPPKPFQVSSQRVLQVTSLIEKELLNFDKGLIDPFVRKGSSCFDQCPKDFLDGNPEETAKELAASITPLIISNIQAQIAIKRTERLSKLSERNITEAELVSLGSPIVHRPKLYKGADELILKSTKNQLKWKKFQAQEIAEQLVYTVMQELVKGGEIFFFDPAYYTEGHNNCWIRY